MDKKEIITVLEEWNFWSRPLVETFPRYKYEHAIAQKIKAKEVVFVKGVRRCGKSTLLINHIKNLLQSGIAKENILYVNLEDPRFLPYLSTELLQDIKDAHKYYLEPKGNVYIFLDEIQNIPFFEKWLLKEYEIGNSYLFASGSNAILLSKEIGTALSGRYLDVEVFPLSFREFLVFKNVNVNTKYDFIANKTTIEKCFEEYLNYGGFPKVVLLEDEDLKKSELKSYFDSILLRDIVARYKLEHFKILEQMSVLLLSSVANLFSINKLKGILHVSYDLANTYFEYIVKSYMLIPVSLFSWSLKKQTVNQKKIYSIDTGLSKRVSFEVGKRRGSLLENIIFLELLRDNKEIYYYRTGQGYEVDFLIKDGEKITHLIQVTESLKDEKIIKRETRALVKAKEELKYADKARLLILTMGGVPSTLESCSEIEMQNIMEFMCLR